MCSNSCNLGDPTNDPQGVTRPGVCNDGGPGDPFPIAQLCEPGTDCQDCGVRIFCLDCPPACHERNMQRPNEGCMESQWNDGKCDASCNNPECEFNDCTLSQIASVCVQAHVDEGLDYSGAPADPRVTVILDMEAPRLAIDSVTNQMIYTCVRQHARKRSAPILLPRSC